MSTPSVKNKSTSLCRSESDQMIAGVCGGIAAYFGLESSLVRLIFIIISLLGGSGIAAYAILWLLLPVESDINKSSEVLMKKESVSEPKKSDSKSGKSTWGLFLIGFGLVLLLQNFGFARYLMLDKTWPALLIIAGVYALGK